MSEHNKAEIGEVEALLRRTAEAFPYPPTPGISQAVASRLQESSGPGGSILERLFEMGSRGASGRGFDSPQRS